MTDLNIALTESASLRSAQISKYGDTEALTALQKAKGLVMAVWQGTNIATTQQIAEYYEVKEETIQQLYHRNRKELTQDGVKLVKGEALKDVVEILSPSQTRIPSLLIWTPRSTLRVGLQLRDSEVAKEVRNVVLDIVEAVPAFADKPLPRQLPPVRDAKDNLETAAGIAILDNPILKSLLEQQLMEELTPTAKLITGGNEAVPKVILTVRAAELGYKSSQIGSGSGLGKFIVKQGIQPIGKVQHGKYPVNVFDLEL